MTQKIKIPTFDAEIVFVSDVEKDYVIKYVKRRYGFEIERIEQEFLGITVELDLMSWMIYIPDTEQVDFIQLVRTLSHESNHVVLQLMRKVGVQDDETVCYCQDNILGELLKKVMKKKKKKESSEKIQRKK